MLTSHQLRIYQHVYSLMDNDDGYCRVSHAVHVDGHAGHGKTYILYLIIGWVCKKYHIAIVTTSTGLSAKNYPGGRTLHSTYNVPVSKQ